VDWFGAEEGLTLAKAAEAGRLDAVYRSCLPAEIQAIRVGPWWFVGWPGEIFVEYALAVKAQRPHTFIISLANGELQGYIATEEAADGGGYEASNALFAPLSGQILVDATLELLAQ
jgi:neutral ceramidase